MNISVLGLGKLGLCTAACFAAKGHRVMGVDHNPSVVKSLREGQTHIHENGLDDLLSMSRSNLAVTEDTKQATFDSDITLVIVPTPSKTNGKFTNRYIGKALTGIGKALAEKSRFHVVNIVSTVMPGSCDNYFIPLLEQVSGKTCGKDFGLVYNPEFIALGNVIDDFLNPDMVLIGASDDKSGSKIRELYLSTCENIPEIATMTLINAEITKLSLNCYVTMKISFSNELASLCEKTSGADVDVITTALGLDKRIGPSCIKAGLGFGGPCFPRDNRALQVFAREMGLEARIGPQVVAINNTVIDRLFACISKGIAPAGNIALLGLSYKPETPIIEASQPVMLAKRLADVGYAVRVWDPKALDSAREVLGQTVSYHVDVYGCVRDSEAILLLTDWPEQQGLDWNRIRELSGENTLIVDAWRRLARNVPIGFRYKALGLGQNGPI